MATEYFGETDRTRGKLIYSTSQTDTKYTITLSATLQAKSYYGSGYRISTFIDGTQVATKLSYVPDIYTSFTDVFSTSSYSKTYTRTTSAQTVKIKASYDGEYDSNSGYSAGSKSGSKEISITIPALASYTITYNANGGTLGSVKTQTKTYGVDLKLTGTATRTGYTFQGWGTSASDTSVDYKAGASYTANSAITLYAIWKVNTYTITYNANGGTGAPSAQTKTYGKALTLSNTKPTRTGYTFLGWSTSKTATSATYDAGGTLAADVNTNTTLYAVWGINTYTITYNANGGTLGSVKTQTKTYGVDLKLTGTATRTGYTFQGWATSASATSAKYAAGASYTSNAAVTLYAVWELAYTKPKISGMNGAKLPTVYRCDVDGNPSDDGTSIYVSFSWSTFSTSYPGETATISYRTGTGAWTNETIGLGSNSNGGSVEKVIVDKFSIDSSYDIKITVTDSSGGNSSFTTTLSTAFFTLDFGAGGKSIGVGCAAPDAGAHANGLMKINMDLQLADDKLPLPCTRVTTAGTNLDDYKELGIYTFSGNYTPENIPSGLVNGALIVIPDGSSRIKQIWYRYGTANKNDYQTYVRTFTAKEDGSEGSEWSAWARYLTTKDGMLSNSGDVFGSTSVKYRTPDKNGSIALCNGNDPTEGAGIWLFGNGNANAGQFNLQIYDESTGTYRQLRGYPNGNLMWNGQRVLTYYDNYYKPGDSFKPGTQGVFPAIVTSGTTRLCLQVTLPKLVSDVDVTVDSVKGVFRGVNGYVNSMSDSSHEWVSDVSSLTIAKPAINSVILYLNFGSALTNCVNNTSCNFTGTMSLSFT